MITVRNAFAGDVPRIQEIFNESMTPSWTHDSLLRELEKNDSFFLVAEEDTSDFSPSQGLSSCVVGFAIFRQVGDDGELLQISTCKNVRRRGVADSLLLAVLGFASQMNFNLIHLEVRISNEAAVSLYEKHGFKRMRVRSDYYNTPVEDALIMVRSIS